MTFCVENLNTIVDHPGVPLARAKDTLALVEAVAHPNVRMMLDLYHAQAESTFAPFREWVATLGDHDDDDGTQIGWTFAPHPS